MDGAGGYRFRLVGKQLVHEIVSGIWDAVNKSDWRDDLVIICNGATVLSTQTALQFTTPKLYPDVIL
jgi:hypothetical protein